MTTTTIELLTVWVIRLTLIASVLGLLWILFSVLWGNDD